MLEPLSDDPQVALVHDWLNQYGGAERVLETLHALFPQATVFTSMYWPEALPDAYRAWPIRTSFMDRWPLVKQRHQPFLPVYPAAFAALDLTGYRLLLSNKSAFCHGVRKPAGARHLCYCLTPTRFVWDFESYVAHEGQGRLARAVVPLFLGWLKAWDYRAAQEVDAFAAISNAVRERIQRYYGRDAVVIHPPTDVARFTPSDELDDYYLVVSRLIPYKRVDIAVQAFNQLRRRLVIIGDGRDRTRLAALAGPTVEFWGRLPDAEMRRAMARCQALIFPGLEDFGLTPVEAQASGRPVIAYAAGGALDTVIPGLTGALFHPQTAEALAATVARFHPAEVDPALCRQNAARFDVAVFREKLARFVGLES
ncbi:MAG: glycosyltransferase [Anaerolineae bacterium]|nr:glycosyltransferase [Anaerolineae bacterium]